MYGLSQRVRFLTGDDLSKVSADNFGSYIAMPGGSVQIPLGFVGELQKNSFLCFVALFFIEPERRQRKIVYALLCCR